MLKVRSRTNPLNILTTESQANYQLLFENALEPGAILSPVLDMRGRLVDVLLVDANQAFCQAVGIRREQVRGRLARQFAPVLENRVEHLQVFLQDLDGVLKTGQPCSRDIFVQHTQRHYRYQVFLLSNGLAAVTSTDITHLLEKAQETALGTAELITPAPEQAEDRELLESSEVRAMQQEAQLRIQHKIIEMREAERQQTANYLHEGLLQALIGIRYAIEEGLSIERKENRLARLAAVQATLQREIQNLRDYCNDLRPPTLAQFGLEKTIRAYVEVYQKKHPRPVVTLALHSDRQLLPDPYRLALFRIFQELFNRFAGDPNVQTVMVEFGIEAGCAVLEITCDAGWPGQNLDWAALAQQGQISLASALGWVEGLGGQIEIQPLAENKSKVRIVIPISSET